MKRLGWWDRPWFVLTSSWKEAARVKVKPKRGAFFKGMSFNLFQMNKLNDSQKYVECKALCADKDLLLLFLFSFSNVPFLLDPLHLPPRAAAPPPPPPSLNSRLLHEVMQCTCNIRRHPATGTSSGDKSKTPHSMRTRTQERYPAFCLYCIGCPAAV